MAAVAMGVAGAAVGFFAGGGPTGAALGWSIGYGLGTALFPEKLNVPHPDEIRFRPAGYGNFKPYIWGTMRIAGIPVDGPPTLTAHEGSSGGKGGPSQPTPTTYSIDFLREFFCVSRGTHEVLALYFNKRLVGDYRTGATVSGDLPVTFYNGAADQAADPTEEAFYGVGNVTAYRNRLTCVFDNLSLGDVGNTPPNVEALVANGAAHTDKPLETLTYNANDDSPGGHVWPKHSAGATFNGNGPAITAWPEDGTTPIRVRDSQDTKVYTYDQTTLEYIGFESPAAGDGWPAAFNNNDGDPAYLGIGYYKINDVRTPLWGAMHQFKVDGTSADGGPGTGAPISTVLPVQTGGSFGGSQYSGSNILAGSGMASDDVVVGAMLSQNERMLFVMVTTAAQYVIDSGVIDKWYKLIDGIVTDFGAVVAWPSNSGGMAVCGSTTRNGPTLCGMFENDYETAWIAAGNVAAFSVWYINDNNEFILAPQHEVAVTSSLPLPDSVALCWIAIYALAGGCKCGMVNGNLSAQSAWLAERCTINTGQQRLYEVVADIHELEGDPPERYDVTELIDIVRGFGILQQMSGRAAIEALAPIFTFGYREHYDGTNMVVQYVKRGKPTQGEFLDDDLCAHDEHGNDIPSPLQIIKGVDTEIPCAIFLKFIDPAMEYQMNVATWRRQDTTSKLVTTMECSVVLTRDEAQRIVDMLGQNAINEADKYIWYSTRKYSHVEPEDVRTVKGYDLRIQTKHDNMATGVIRWEGVRSHPGVIVQTGAGGGGSESFEPQEIPIPQDTELLLLDAPYIPDDSREGVITVGMRGALRSSWRGASLQKATDGTNYSQVVFSNAPAGMGEALTVLAPYGGGNTFDECSSVDILMHTGGTLDSYSRGQTMAGIRPYMVGAEMIYARSAELIDTDTYRLTELLRGRKGTKWAMRGHAVGDKFLDLKSALQINAEFGEYGTTIPYKAVTAGRTLATASAVPFGSYGVSRAPFAPVHVGVGRDGSGNILISWTRCARIHSEWLDFVGVPLDEEIEKYRIQIFEDGSFQTVKRTIIVIAGTEFDPTVAPYGTFAPDDPRAMYTVADQTTDFGGAVDYDLPITIQQWGHIGWGYDTLGRLPPIVPTTIPEYVPPNPDPADGINSTMPWVEATRIYSGTFGPNDRWYIQFTTGGTPSGGGGLVILSGAEFTGPPSPREWCLSPIKGDFSAAYSGAMPGSRGGGSPTVDARFVVGSGSDFGYYPTIPTTATWYLNIRNQATSYDDVPMFMDLLNVP